MKNFRLATTVKGRRKQLIKFLEDHADYFNMDIWIADKDSYTTELRGLLEERKLTPNKAIQLFEQCGTACCIGGAMEVLTAEHAVSKLLEIFHIKNNGSTWDSDLFYVWEWPEDLREEYEAANRKNDYRGMVEAGIKAIDHFAAE